jgi:hypothetical protein
LIKIVGKLTDQFYDDITFRMRAIASFPSRGKGAFALRRDLQAKKEMFCDLHRFPENVHGAISEDSLN